MIGLKMYNVLETKEYKNWFKEQTLKSQAQIQARIVRIRTEGHFGIVRKLDRDLAELKWKSGRRIYFSVSRDESGKIIILLLGGSKNTQAKDIKKARSIIQKLTR